jgi:hypothetical protein
MYSQYVLVMHCLKNIVASLYHHYGCWSERFGYSIYNITAIDSVALKKTDDDLGFTQNNFGQNASFKIQPMLIYIII